jgi:hypothetical protein
MIDHNDIDNLRKIFVATCHSNAVNGLLSDLMTYFKRGNDMACGFVFGPTNAGKSGAIELFNQQYPVYIEGDRRITPVVHSPLMSANMSVKTMAMDILSLLGAGDHAKTETANQLTHGLITQLKLQEVGLLIIDEFQQIFERSISLKLRYEVADWIKALLNAKVCPIVISGLSRLEDDLTINQQLQVRSAGVVRITPAPMRDHGDLMDYAAFLHKFFQATPIQFDGVRKPEMIRRIHLATEGYAGRHGSLFQAAARMAVKEGAKTVTQKHFADGWSFIKLQKEGVDNPFTMPAEKVVFLQQQETGLFPRFGVKE